MGYVKIKKASGFDLLSADNIGHVKVDTSATPDSIVVAYIGGASGSDVASTSNQASSMYVPSFASQDTNTEENTTKEQAQSKEKAPSTSSSSSSSSAQNSKKADKSEGGDYFDIPAFLRKQAD